MPRKNLIRTNIFPYHVTSRCHNKEWFDLPMQEVWIFAQKSLSEAHKLYPIELISFVLMGNHYHMILKTPSENLDLFMREFNRRFALKIRNKSEKINQVFGGRYKWSLISASHYFVNCYRYVYQNPVRAGISRRCEEYPFSTLRYLINCKPFIIPIYDHYGFKDEWGLRWLNESISDQEKRCIRTGLTRSEFRASS